MMKVILCTAVLVFLISGPMIAAASKRGRIDTPTLRLCEKKGKQLGLSPDVILACKAIACKESSCGTRPEAAREKSNTWHRRAIKIAKTPREYEDLMSSWGSWKLSGVFTKIEKQKEPIELVDDDVSISIVLPRIDRTMKACSGSRKCTYARWNGGDGWTKSAPDARVRVAKYADATMQWESNV